MSSSKRKRVASSATVPVLMGSTEVLLLLRKLRTVLRRKLDADDNTDDDADDDEHDAGAAATAAADGTGTATTGGGAQGKKERQRQRHRRVAEPWREGAKQAVAVGFNEASRLVDVSQECAGDWLAGQVDSRLVRRRVADRMSTDLARSRAPRVACCKRR